MHSFRSNKMKWVKWVTQRVLELEMHRDALLRCRGMWGLGKYESEIAKYLAASFMEKIRLCSGGYCDLLAGILCLNDGAPGTFPLLLKWKRSDHVAYRIIGHDRRFLVSLTAHHFCSWDCCQRGSHCDICFSLQVATRSRWQALLQQQTTTWAVWKSAAKLWRSLRLKYSSTNYRFLWTCGLHTMNELWTLAREFCHIYWHLRNHPERFTAYSKLSTENFDLRVSRLPQRCNWGLCFLECIATSQGDWCPFP
jgi:hypothetical protein